MAAPLSGRAPAAALPPSRPVSTCAPPRRRRGVCPRVGLWRTLFLPRLPVGVCCALSGEAADDAAAAADALAGLVDEFFEGGEAEDDGGDGGGDEGVGPEEALVVPFGFDAEGLDEEDEDDVGLLLFPDDDEADGDNDGLEYDARQSASPSSFVLPTEDDFFAAAPSIPDAALPRVALVGRPNVGKSAIFNRICGAPHAVVSDYPGVTRDRLFRRARHGEQEFLLVDTGGIEEAARAFERDAMRRCVPRQLAAVATDVRPRPADAAAGRVVPKRPADPLVLQRLLEECFDLSHVKARPAQELLRNRGRQHVRSAREPLPCCRQHRVVCCFARAAGRCDSY